MRRITEEIEKHRELEQSGRDRKTEDRVILYNEWVEERIEQ